MWRVIDGMSKDVNEFVQRGTSMEDEEDIEPFPTVENPAKEEPIPNETSAIAQPTKKGSSGMILLLNS